MNNIQKVKAKMKTEGIDWYLLTQSDAHQSEYVSKRECIINWICGFDGSNATLLIGKDDAFLWTDGRYFLQAQKQLRGSNVKLMKMGVSGYPTVERFIETNVKRKETLGFDGKKCAIITYKKYKDLSEKKGFNINIGFDPTDNLWEDRPCFDTSQIWALESEYSGKESYKKIKEIRLILKKKKAKAIFFSDLTQIAWILNLRGSDVDEVLVFYSFLYIDLKSIVLYVKDGSLDDSLISFLRKNTDEGIVFKDYEDVYSDLGSRLTSPIMLDPYECSIAIRESFGPAIDVLEEDNPVNLLKAVKNPIEIKNTIDIHEYDGAAVTKFIYYIKKQIESNVINNLSELDVSDTLLNLRSSIPGFLSESFSTIAAYGKNAAMMHYSAKADDFSMLDNNGYLLIDSGGHYLKGTTDITRTIALGNLTYEQKKMYTLVLKSHLNLMGACFVDGVTGENLDILSRGALWKLGLDYRSGTGHGVGHLLSVHEGPHSIRWRYIKDKSPVKLVPGMIVTDEPGYYEDNSYGIRIENELLCSKYKNTEYGTFYHFKPITFAPYETEAILFELLSKEEIDIYNNYNQLLRRKLKKYLSNDERAWLFSVTKKV